MREKIFRSISFLDIETKIQKKNQQTIDSMVKGWRSIQNFKVVLTSKSLLM